MIWVSHFKLFHLDQIASQSVHEGSLKNLQPLGIQHSFIVNLYNIIAALAMSVLPLLISRALYMKALSAPGTNNQQVSHVEDLQYKSKGYFAHDYWFRVCSILFMPTFLACYVQVTSVGGSTEQLASFVIAVLVLIILMTYYSLVWYRCFYFFQHRIAPALCNFFKEDVKDVAAMNILFYPIDLTRKLLLVCLVSATGWGFILQVFASLGICIGMAIYYIQ